MSACGIGIAGFTIITGLTGLIIAVIGTQMVLEGLGSSGIFEALNETSIALGSDNPKSATLHSLSHADYESAQRE